jgi:hypothetical protein
MHSSINMIKLAQRLLDIKTEAKEEEKKEGKEAKQEARTSEEKAPSEQLQWQKDTGRVCSIHAHPSVEHKEDKKMGHRRNSAFFQGYRGRVVAPPPTPIYPPIPTPLVLPPPAIDSNGVVASIPDLKL